MKIAVVGAGPAGNWVSILLARQGHSVTLLDPQAPWEKPCGGGVTTRVLGGFGIPESGIPSNLIEKITIFFGDKNSVSIAPQQPLAVLSRRELGKHLVAEAQKAGVMLVKSRASQLHRNPKGRGWRISTRESELQVDFLIGADGATSFVRRTVGKALAPEDLAVTLGYLIPCVVPAHMKIYFVPSFEGYIWSFPRPNHISYGLITRSLPGWTGRAKMLLSNFIVADLGTEAIEQAEFYSAPVPCLGPHSWKNNQVCGPDWALVGDAAGLADPITGEGIYFAFRSAEILAQTLERPDEYATKIWSELGCDLARASDMYRRFYQGRFLGGDFRKRTIQLSRRSRTLRTILGNLVTGNQPYLGLKRKLFFSIPSIGVDLITGR
jgi:geranylgeranyl reductase family protein